MALSTSLRVVFASALLVTAVSASDLKVDGGTAASVPVGGSFQLDLTGNPNLPGFLLYDLAPGPVSLFGESIPLGNTPALRLLVGGTTSGGGLFTTPYFLPDDTSLAGVTVYFAGVIFDPADPNGLDFSNGAQISIIPKVGAGADQSTMVGRGVALDGSGAADAGGQLPLGVSVNWNLIAVPPGSLTTLQEPTSMFPMLTPDLPGTYSIRMSVLANGSFSSADTKVHAYQVTLTPGLDGTYSVFPFASVQGNVQGPSIAQFLLNGSPTALSGTGDFGPVFQSIPAGDIFLPVLVEVQHSGGSATRDRFSMAQGFSTSISTDSSEALGVHLNQSGLDAIATVAKGELANADIGAILLGLGTVEVINTEDPLFGLTIFSAYVTFTSFNYDNNATVLQLTAVPGGVSGLVQLSGIQAFFSVNGEIIEIDYSLSGDISTSPVDMSATIAFTAVNGTIQTSVSNVAVTANNFSYNLNGFLGSIA